VYIYHKYVRAAVMILLKVICDIFNVHQSCDPYIAYLYEVCTRAYQTLYMYVPTNTLQCCVILFLQFLGNIHRSETWSRRPWERKNITYSL